jgi:general secretion pathway protein N
MMTKKTIVLSFALFLFFLLWTMPARTVIHWLPDSIPFKATGISGSIWSGHAASISINRQSVTDVEWLVNPLWFFTGKVGGSINIKDPSIKAEGAWRLGLDQTLYLSDMSLTIDAERLASYLPFKGVVLQGDVRADIQSVTFHPQVGPSDLEAKIYWLKGSASIAGPVVKLGNFTLLAQSQDDNTIKLTLQKAQNSLDAQGDILIRWNKDIALNISVTEQVPEQLQSTIAFLKPDNKGRRQLQMTIPFKR